MVDDNRLLRCCMTCSIAVLAHAGLGYLAMVLFGVSGVVGNLVGYGIGATLIFLAQHGPRFDDRAHALAALMEQLPWLVVGFMLTLSVTAILSVLAHDLPHGALPMIGAGVLPLLGLPGLRHLI